MNHEILARTLLAFTYVAVDNLCSFDQYITTELESYKMYVTKWS